MAYRYSFVDLHCPAIRKPTFYTKFCGRVLDELPGIESVLVEGRGLLDRELNTVEVPEKDGEILLSSRVRPKDLTLVVRIDPRDKNAPDLLRHTLKEWASLGVRALSFSDEDGWEYLASLCRIDYPENRNQGFARLTFRIHDPYQYKPFNLRLGDYEDGYHYSIFPLDSPEPVQIDEMVITPQLIRTQVVDVSFGDVEEDDGWTYFLYLKCDPKDKAEFRRRAAVVHVYPGDPVSVRTPKGESLMEYVDPISQLDNAILRGGMGIWYEDMAERITIKGKLRRLA